MVSLLSTPQTIAARVTKLVPIQFELCVIAAFSLLWFFLVTIGNMPVVLPDRDSLTLVFNHYVVPLLIAFILQVAVLAIMKLTRKSFFGLTANNIFITSLYIPFIIIVVFLHFNFKSWMPLINPNTYDTVYYSIDKLLPFANWLKSLGYYLDFGGIASSLYHCLFVLMFMVAFIAHAVFDTFTNFRKVIVGTCLVLLLGSVSYWIMPAVGPFIFVKSEMTNFSQYQEQMYSLYCIVVNTGTIPSGYFSNAPAAMPSLHVANSFFFLMSAKKIATMACSTVCPAIHILCHHRRRVRMALHHRLALRRYPRTCGSIPSRQSL